MGVTDAFGFAIGLIGFGITIWQLVKTKSAAEAARSAASEAVLGIRRLQTASTLQEMAGRTRNLLELLRAKNLSSAASAAFELRDTASRLPQVLQTPQAVNDLPWREVNIEIDSIHERLESMKVINRWTADERESLIHRTARLHTKLAAGAVQVAASKEHQ